MTAAEQFVEDARGVTVDEACAVLGIALAPKAARAKGWTAGQLCPACGGSDRFALNRRKNIFVCRGSAGGDMIALAQHVEGCGFRRACEILNGADWPDAAPETDDEKAARARRRAERAAKAEAAAAARDADDNRYRAAERDKARGIYDAASRSGDLSRQPVEDYLLARVPALHFAEPMRLKWLRCAPSLPYWHGEDGNGDPCVIHQGPAMVAPFVRIAPDLSGAEFLGCHITWIDLANRSKFRPLLYETNKAGVEAGRPYRAGPQTAEWPPLGELRFYELLPTKKMRGTKKGGLIPLAGSPRSPRWVAGEGIEKTVAVARAEDWRADTFYCAAGDLGNLAGPADHASDFTHPALKKADRNGRWRAVRVAGPLPRPGSGADCMSVPEHVTTLVLLADPGSERVMTAAAMARARARFETEHRAVAVVWPPSGVDFDEIGTGDPS